MPNILEGKIINSIEISEDKEALKFNTSDSNVIVKTDADCCSYTWIENVELPAGGFPALVVSVQNLQMPDLGDLPGHDVMAYYGCKITTDKGDIIIDYRNDSNGYYGGSLCWPGESHYGGVYGQNNSNEKWQPLGEK